MLKLPVGRAVALGLTIASLVCSSDLLAQSNVSPLIVVADESDAEWIKRIGGKHVRVETLFEESSPDDYGSCDRRVRELLNFQLFVFRGGTATACEAFWRQRMTTENPQGRLRQLGECRCGVELDVESKVRRVTEIHRILVSALPKHRSRMDANLDSELRNLRAAQQFPQFASRD